MTRWKIAGAFELGTTIITALGWVVSLFAGKIMAWMLSLFVARWPAGTWISLYCAQLNQGISKDRQ